MRISKVLAACCAALLITGTAAAEIGSFSFSHTVGTGSGQIDFALTSSTYGASSTTAFEGLSNDVYLYGSTLSTWSGTWEYRSVISLNSMTGPPYAMRLTSNFSFAGLPPGTYSYWVGGQAWYWSTYYSSWIYPTYDYAVGSALVGVYVPTVGQYGLLLLGLTLAASGVILLRRV